MCGSFFSGFSKNYQPTLRVKNAKRMRRFIPYFEPKSVVRTPCTELEFDKMAGKLVKQILLQCLFNILVVENAALPGCPKTKFACLCGERPDDEVKLFEIQPEFAYNESKDCTQLSSEVCASHSCLISLPHASNSVVDVGERALRGNLFHPVKIPFPLLGGDARETPGMLRDRRSAQKCPLPQAKNSAISCYLWGEFTVCIIKCSGGYALEENGKVMLKTKRTCELSKAVWSPQNTFPLCKPYINCEAILVKPGELTCYPGSEIQYCDISCKMDVENDLEEAPMNRYECVDGHFAEILPHCATVKKNVDMIKLPEILQMTVLKTG